MWIAIVDMEQPGIRQVVVMTDEDDKVALFSSPDEIRKLRENHPLNVFHWWFFNVESGEVG